jgi:hypothetical protein
LCVTIKSLSDLLFICRLNVLHMLSAPVGLIAAPSQSSPNSNGDYTAHVMLTGTMTGLSYLQTGAVYYSNTLGELLGGEVWLGKGAGSPSVESVFSYYEDEASGTLVDCRDSLVGVAVSDSILLLKTN